LRTVFSSDDEKRLFTIWRSMKMRCYNPKNESYNHYGGRGISICEEWRGSFPSFYTWAVLHGYSGKLTIDRIDVNGDYCPENCRWITNAEQQRNRSNNVKLFYNGRFCLLQELAEQKGIKHQTLYSRVFLLGWDVEKAVNTPARKRRAACSVCETKQAAKPN